MNSAEFDRQFSRLAVHFHLPTDESRDTLQADWFAALQHYHVDALERGVTDLIRTHPDTFWPPLSKLLGAIKNKLAGMERTRATCDTCQGSSWIDAWPMKEPGTNAVYEFMQRCSECGVPSPVVKERKHLVALTAAEYQQWKAGEWPTFIPTPKPNHSALEALRHINPKRGRMARALEGAAKTPADAA